MQKDDSLNFSLWMLIYPLFFGLAIWGVYWFELNFGFDFSDYGIYPRSFKGLRGIFFSPFIHGSVSHLYSNTLPLMILSAALFYFYNKISWKVILLGILFSGLLTWFIGRPSHHIGASGLIYVLVSFIFFKGIIAKNKRLIALSLVTVFSYGSMFWFIFPIKEEISWEGHLSGFMVGLALAFIFKNEVLRKETYEWEHEDFDEASDPFLKHFDQDGNFIENTVDEAEALGQDNNSISITYHYIEKGKEKDSNESK
ncbi:rhomboid family intramembrane serine protease [Galbibacter pacificus]|uniref:Rhomboid family intramembrane serine protease n=1 Tax=Galbibacter pacificus TaxID=2996052 RepID=A0ABT6FM47_9FLAO|nr:rhomboid family intramembrane serine protease [Galbibacter pacificus]MDG3580861.1 rhomboid family intramembrane serine protease [Galbibacter pacificus]MDG3584339.1 rhomboid family intramembrane serine protease [Galbibacter pacificus]